MTRKKPSHNSYTHCQVAQANAHIKTWQRVYLSSRTTDRQMNKEREALGGNITYTQAGVSCFVGQESSKFKVQFFVGSSVVKIPACV